MFPYLKEGTSVLPPLLSDIMRIMVRLIPKRALLFRFSFSIPRIQATD